MAIKMINEFDDFRNLIKENIEIFSLVWRCGDGKGDWAISEIERILGCEYGNRNNAHKGKKKKKIRGIIRIAVMERDYYRCKHCDTHKDLTIDHIIPESKGGTLDIENLQTLCRTCNSKKGVSQ